MVQPNPYLKKAKIYQAGLSAEEIKQIYKQKNQRGLKTVLQMASNENPLPPPEGLLKALTKTLSHINRYPSYTYPVVQSASLYYQVEPEQVVLGNGSSELIDKLMQAYAISGQSAILIFEKTFPLYAICAKARGLLVYKADMEQKNLKVNVPSLLDLWKKHHHHIRLIFISNPNNPTGSYITQKEVELLLSATKGQNTLLIMDEAYQDYARATDFPHTIPLLSQYPHLVLLRSLSKVMGLAGLRAGVMLAHPSVIKNMKKVLCPFNVNALSLQAMQYGFSHKSFNKYLLKSKKLVWEGLDYFYQELHKMGLDFYPSQGNFLLFRPPHPEAFSLLLKQGLILRPLKEPKLKKYLRMSVGTALENKKALRLIKALEISQA